MADREFDFEEMLFQSPSSPPPDDLMTEEDDALRRSWMNMMQDRINAYQKDLQCPGCEARCPTPYVPMPKTSPSPPSTEARPVPVPKIYEVSEAGSPLFPDRGSPSSSSSASPARGESMREIAQSVRNMPTFSDAQDTIRLATSREQDFSSHAESPRPSRDRKCASAIVVSPRIRDHKIVLSRSSMLYPSALLKFRRALWSKDSRTNDDDIKRMLRLNPRHLEQAHRTRHLEPSPLSSSSSSSSGEGEDHGEEEE